MNEPLVQRQPPAYVLEGVADIWQDWRRTLGLLRQLTRRHLAARYRGSALGFFWSLLHPLLMMCIYTVVFQYIFRLSAPGVPYPAFFLTGLLAWNFMQTAAMNGAMSIVDNASLIQKTYFPRIVLPLAAVASNLVNYLVAIPLLILFCGAFGIWPTAAWAWFPLALLQLLALTLGVALITASLTPFFRDLVQLLDVLFLGWFFATPVLYPVGMPQQNLPGWAYRLYELNPMAGAVMWIRHVILGEAVVLSTLMTSLLGTLLLLALGLVMFQRLAPRFSTAI